MSDPAGPFDLDLDVAAATLQSDTRDVQVLLRVLVKQLSEALGERLAVQRKGGLLKKSDEIRALRITMGEETYEADVERSALSCTIGRVSGGIRIRSEKVGMDEWLKRLLAALKAEAAHSSVARQALENIVIGGPL